MCGIFAYSGGRDASDILLEGLRSLEYRGYDSSGLYIPEAGCIKTTGPVSNLQKKVTQKLHGKSGIAHLRWATHGEPTEENAHPHTDCSERFWVVHNGIIENYSELKELLIHTGHSFVSQTDTEVIAHLIEEEFNHTNDFERAVYQAVKKLKGSYGLVVSYKGDPTKILVARMGSPIALGIGEGEHFVASDASPILPHTKRIVYLFDGEVAVLTPDHYTVTNMEGEVVQREPETITWDTAQAQKDGFAHFMLKEIMEQSAVLARSLKNRTHDEGTVCLDELDPIKEVLKDIERIVIVGCGTSYYAGLIGEYAFEEYTHIPTEVEFASEFRYRNAPLNKKTLCVAISQSGETADTLEALREARRKGATVLSVVNVVGSTIARESDAVIYNFAGPEIGVASTKAFLSQTSILFMLAAYIAHDIKGVKFDSALVRELTVLPDKIKEVLERESEVQVLVKKYAAYKDFLFLGRGYNYPTALEGALKLKEIAYVHAEGCSAGEMKHGPLAMIDGNFPSIVIIPSDGVYHKLLSNIQEIKARGGSVLAIASSSNTAIADIVDDVFFVPETHHALAPILSVLPLQLFAYHFAVALGKDPDKPRNLAKSVTVE